MASRNRLISAALAAATGTALSCGASGASAPDTAAIEPHANLVATGCTSKLGQAKVNALFAAFNQQDATTLATLFPEPSTWRFSHRPDGAVVSEGDGVLVKASPRVQALVDDAVAGADPQAILRVFPAAGAWELRFGPPVDALARSGPLAPGELRAVDHSQLPALLAGLSGLHFVFTEPLRATAGSQKYVSPQGTVHVQEVNVSPVMWRATGPALERRGRHAVHGAGKLTLYCEKAAFSRAALGASSVE